MLKTAFPHVADGSSEFIPVSGRWVVERTFSWMQTYRRMMRNYEQYPHTARHMALLALIFSFSGISEPVLWFPIFGDQY